MSLPFFSAVPAFSPSSILAVYFALRYTSTARSLLGPFDPPLDYHLHRFPLRAMLSYLGSLPPLHTRQIYSPFLSLTTDLFPNLVCHPPLSDHGGDAGRAEEVLTAMSELLTKAGEDGGGRSSIACSLLAQR